MPVPVSGRLPGRAGDPKHDAAQRVRDIRKGLTTIAHTIELVKLAYEMGDHITLGYGSWEDYCRAEYGEAVLLVPKGQRDQIVADLADTMSVRAIATVLGVGKSTVARQVTGGTGYKKSIDGRSRPAAARPKRKPAASKPASRPAAGPERKPAGSPPASRDEALAAQAYRLADAWRNLSLAYWVHDPVALMTRILAYDPGTLSRDHREDGAFHDLAAAMDKWLGEIRAGLGRPVLPADPPQETAVGTTSCRAATSREQDNRYRGKQPRNKEATQ